MHPSREELTGLALGTIDEHEAEQLTNHIEQCPACEETLQALETAADDAMVQAIRQPTVAFPEQQESECGRLLLAVQEMGRDRSFAATGPGPRSDAPPLKSIRDYELLEVLGRGGMGTVYKALHTRLDKVVALKVLPADRVADDQAVRRFEREMKAVGKLRHANIVQATDAGQEAGRHYLVMELIEGLDLSQLSDRLGPLDPSVACELVRQAAIGLQHAHEHGLVHRDIKPSNLMLNRDGRVKILDLGLAMLAGPQQELQGELTSTGQFMGTIDYMAPEQGGDSRNVDIRADLYSLGASLYKLLTGRAPFAGKDYDTPMKKITALATSVPESVKTVKPETPAELSDLVDRLLSKDPADRVSTPSELSDRLAPFSDATQLTTLLNKASQSTREGAAEADTHTERSTDDGLDREELAAGRVHSRLPSTGNGNERPRQTDSKSQASAATPITYRRILAAVLVGSLLIAALFFSGVFHFRTTNGEVFVDIPDGVKVDVLLNGDKAKIEYVDGGRRVKLTIEEGDHDLVVTTADGIRLMTESDRISFKLNEQGKVIRAWFAADKEVASSKPLAASPQHAAPIISRTAFVTAPAKLPGVRSWTIDTRGHRGPIERFLFHPKKDELITRGLRSQSLRIYEIPSGKLRRVIPVTPQHAGAVALSTDGEQLAVAEVNGLVRIYDYSTGRRVHELQCPKMEGKTPWIGGLCWSPDGQRLAVQTNIDTSRNVDLFRVEQWRLERRCNYAVADTKIDHADAVQFSADSSRILISGYEPQTIDADSGECVLRLTVPQGERISAIYSPDQTQIATADTAGNITLRSATTGKVEAAHQAAGDTTLPQFSWLNDGSSLLAVTNSGVVVLDKKLQPRLTLEVDDVWGRRLAVSPSNEHVAVATFRGLEVMELTSGQMVTPLTTVNYWGEGTGRVAVSPDGKTIGICNVAGKYGTVGRFYTVDCASGRALHHAPVQQISNFCWSPDGQAILLSGSGGSLETFRLQEQAPPKPLASVPSHIFHRGMDLSRDGSRLVLTHEDNTVSIIDAKTGERIHHIQDLEHRPYDIAISPDGRQFALLDQKLSVWDMATGKMLRTYAQGIPGGRIDYSRDGSMIATIRGVFRGEELLNDTYHLPVAPQSRAFAKTSDRYCSFYTLEDGVMRLEIRHGDQIVLNVENVPLSASKFADWAADDRYLVASGAPGQVALFESATGDYVCSILQTPDGPHVSISAAGHYSGPEGVTDHIVYVLQMEDGSLQTLTPAEFSARFDWTNDPSRIMPTSKEK